MGGAAGAGAPCPLVITTADSHTTADAATPTSNRLEFRVIDALTSSCDYTDPHRPRQCELFDWCFGQSI